MCCERINSFNFSTFPKIPIIRIHLQIANPILGSGLKWGTKILTPKAEIEMRVE